MNKRQIILDFTSLLDVIMIILFFFILFARIETDNAKAVLDGDKAALEEQQAQLTEQQSQIELQQIQLQEDKEKYEVLIQEEEDYLNELNSSESAAAMNVAGIHEFSQGTNLKINLNMNNDNWRLDVFSGKEPIGEVSNDSSNNMTRNLSDILINNGYTKDQTILCEFFYNGNERGTSKAYPTSEEVLKNIRFSFVNFKFSETDTSIFKED